MFLIIKLVIVAIPITIIGSLYMIIREYEKQIDKLEGR